MGRLLSIECFIGGTKLGHIWMGVWWHPVYCSYLSGASKNGMKRDSNIRKPVEISDQNCLLVFKLDEIYVSL